MEDAKKHDSDHFREEKHPETNASTTSNHPEMENRQTKTSSSSSSSPRAVVYDISQRTVVVRTEENNHKTTPSEIIDDQRNNNNDNDRTRGLSDYELLRLRNIQRNNARLAALGLLDHPIESSLSAKTKTTSKRARKRPATTIPTRRSSRNRRSVSSLVEQESSLMDTSLGVVDSSSRRPSMQVEPSEEVEEKEEFTVSPLLQYNMNNHPQSCHQEEVAEAKHNADSVPAEITSLSPVGPRLQPPKGLGAIYSLQFFPSFSGANDHKKSWLVGAGKAGIVALWDCNNNNNNTATTVKENKDHGMIDPILSWKAHNGRWIADAKFVPGPASCTNNNADPSRLLTAANDGKLCLWDLTTVSVHSGVPKQLFQTGKELHTSGIFAMDVHNVQEGNSTDSTVCTGSKDKTVAVSSLESIARGSEPMWRSEYHTGKVGAVQLRGGCRGSTLLASASDDGYVAIHDYRTNDIVAELANTHERPHSVVWDPQSSQDVFMTGKTLFGWSATTATIDSATWCACLFVCLFVSKPEAGISQ